MKVLRTLGRSLAALFQKRKLNQEMDDEMRFHLEMRTKEFIADGMSPEEAPSAALRSFGRMEQAKEECRQGWTSLWAENFINDLRHGARTLLKNPGFTIVAVLTLAVGIGADTAIFSSANAILFRPLPFPESDHLVAITATGTQFPRIPASPGDVFEWRQQSQSFESIALVARTATSNLTGAEEPLAVSMQLVSANYFSTLGVQPTLGRAFLPDEDTRGKPTMVVLSYGFWMRRFGGRPDAINETIQLDGQPATIVGVMPQNFTFGVDRSGVDLWVPAVLNWQNRGARYFTMVVGRLKSGVVIGQAQAELSIIAQRLEAQYPDTNKGYGVLVVSLLENYVGDVRPLMLTLLGAVGFLLLLCCVNISNLLLARALSRQKETVIRTALGASRGRIVRQFLTESLLLSTLGGGFGILLANWGTKLLVFFAPHVPRMEEISIDARAVGFTCGITLLTGFAFGIVPALQATRVDLNEALKAGAKGSNASGGKARALLVISEVALALVLLVGAGLFIRSLMELQQVDPGFRTEGAVIAHLNLPRRKYATPQQMTAFADQAVERLSGLPDVAAVGGAVWMPLADGANSQAFALAGQTIADPNKLPFAETTNVTAGYFQAMEIPLRKGRFFSERDVQGAPGVVIINEAMARKYFGDVDPVGKTIGFMGGGAQPDHWSEIVGVVGNVKVYTLRDDENQLEMYEPYAQRPSSALTFIVRGKTAVPDLAGSIRTAISSVDREQPIANISPLADLTAESFATLNFTVFIFAAFSAVALGLAAIGIYGVMAYFVTQRTREIGIRMALGAQRGSVLNLIFSQAARLVAIGLAAGLVCTLGLTQFLQSMLFGIGSRDPLTFATVASLLALVAFIACLLPALRATRIDPIVALRIE